MDENKEEALLKLGSKIREIRESKGLSQTQLAYKIGKDQPSINRLEKGRINPSYVYLLEVSSGLEITIAELLS
ncbi:helix-turn-helix domain-containing protein [Reichenbachiella ulvae]|uniref:Helix-turn-helix domain-containing protein n=1 Tax=Reichenbachiella ulvae TaxID=2980104 RepID=A0ABT3CP94_9BACT|nr:helix-turn-helix transcriptional regulator [Reichenbachiella ulvae]MCV9385284.1 helix-turn-helix domain-containing protein [Reichenbachiella ulvae]